MLTRIVRRMQRLLGGGPPDTLIPEPYIAQSCALVRAALAACDSGDVIEVGVYKGGSLYRFGEEIAAQGRADFGPRRLIGIDTFEGHPYSDPARDPVHHPIGRFADTSHAKVLRAMARFEFAQVYKGECTQVFDSLPSGQSFCFAHVDVDVCQAAISCVEYIYPRLRPGGVMVFDEYAGYGQQEFIDRYFAGKPVDMELRSALGGTDYGLIVRRRPVRS